MYKFQNFWSISRQNFFPPNTSNDFTRIVQSEHTGLDTTGDCTEQSLQFKRRTAQKQHGNNKSFCLITFRMNFNVFLRLCNLCTITPENSHFRHTLDNGTCNRKNFNGFGTGRTFGTRKSFVSKHLVHNHTTHDIRSNQHPRSKRLQGTIAPHEGLHHPINMNQSGGAPQSQIILGCILPQTDPTKSRRVGFAHWVLHTTKRLQY